MELDPLVLIVDDDLGTRVMYRDHLSHAGFRTGDAHNGFQALEMALQLRPNAVLTDLARTPGPVGPETRAGDSRARGSSSAPPRCALCP